MKKESKPLLIKKRYWILFISVFSLLLIAGGYFYYNYSANQIRNDGMQDLTAIAKLKINQIVQWHKERDGDAIVISGETFFIDATEKWLLNENHKTLTTHILNKLSQSQKAYSYEAIILSSINGDVLLSVGSNLAHLDKETSDKVIEAAKNREIEDTDFYYCNTEQKIHYDIIAPLINDKNKVVAVIVLRVDPADFLYPLIQTWPTPSKTAETLLIRKKGDKVLFLNDLRFRKDAALKLEIPLSEKDVPAVQAVLGYKGIWEGNDYRGVKILSYVNNIPGTNWYIVSKIDNDEIFYELKFRLVVITIFTVLLILSVTAGISWIYNFRQRNIYKKLYTTQVGFKTTLYSIGDAVITTDSKGIIQHLNFMAQRITGWSEVDAKGENLEKVFKIINEETRNKLENPIRKVLAEEAVIGLANHTLLISKDGKEIPISDSGSPIKDEAGEIVGVVLVFRDQSEERKNQKLIKDSETKYRRLFESAKDSIIILDAETGKIVDVNPFLIKLLGYSKEKYIEKEIWEIELFKDILADKDDFLELQQKEYIRYEDVPLKTIDGRQIDVEFISNVYLVDHKKVIQCNIRNITERKQTEEALHESERLLRESQTIARLGSFTWDLSTGLWKSSEILDELFGIDEKYIRSLEGWANIVHPDWQETMTEYVTNEVIGKLQKFDKEYQIIRQNDDQKRWIHGLAVLELDSDNQPIRLIGTISDISDRKQAEEDLRKHSGRLQNLHLIDQAILQAIESPEAVVQTAIQHIRELLNCQRVSVGIFDLEKKEVLVYAADVDGKTIVQVGNVLTEEVYGDIDILRQSRMEIVEDSSSMLTPSAINRIIQAEGIQSYINVALVSELKMYGALNIGWENTKTISKEDIEIAGEVANQITIAIEKADLLKETKRYAAELEHRVADRTAQLESANKELESFSYSVSHDLRAPLRGIDGFSNILLEDYSDKFDNEGRRIINVIRSNAQKMGHLIDDLLTFSRITKFELAKSEIDMKALAESIYYEVSTVEETKKISFSVSDIPRATGDSTMIRQLWINLLSNAVKFSSKNEKPVIEINSALENGKTTYSIKDNGVGFDMKYYDKLFGVFQRLHSETEYIGTGVGLAIAKRIVTKHGGEISAVSELNVGTTFYFSL